MKPSKTRYKGKVWYILSCDCVVEVIPVRRHIAALCPRCWEWVFILETCYEKPEDE